MSHTAPFPSLYSFLLWTSFFLLCIWQKLSFILLHLMSFLFYSCQFSMILCSIPY
jgi:hypothetical protein